MRLTKPLNVIIGNQTRVEILRTFFKYPGEFTGRHIARLCELPQATVQKQLQVLVDNDILTFRQIGRSKIFSLKEKSILYPALKSLYEAEGKVLSQVEDLIRKAIRRSSYFRNELVHASIYGSVAKGKETPQSDIDIFLLFKNQFDKHLAGENLENVSEQITTISGMHLHPYAWSLKKFNKLNKELVHNLEENSRLIYGIDLEEVKKKWRSSQRQDTPA